MRDETPRSPDRPAVPAAPASDAASVRLRRARAIFTCACDFPAGERRAFVADSCGGDEDPDDDATLHHPADPDHERGALRPALASTTFATRKRGKRTGSTGRG